MLTATDCLVKVKLYEKWKKSPKHSPGMPWHHAFGGRPGKTTTLAPPSLFPPYHTNTWNVLASSPCRAFGSRPEKTTTLALHRLPLAFSASLISGEARSKHAASAAAAVAAAAGAAPSTPSAAALFGLNRFVKKENN